MSSDTRPFYKSSDWQKCFIGHSYDTSWREVIEEVCSELLPMYGLQPWYAYKYYDPTTTLRDKVVEMIANARYGIYDLSYWRKDERSRWEMPRNVLIELGIAIALNRPTLLLRHAENQIEQVDLPESLKSISQVCEFKGGEDSLRAALLTRLSCWAERSPEQDWRNRYCLFGDLVCPYRDTHPFAPMTSNEKLSCYIADGPDIDQSDFRHTIEKILGRFNNVAFAYLDKSVIPKGFTFLLCAHCQMVRSTPLTIYRITPHTTASTFIAIGISIGLEYQFGYKFPRLMITENMQQVPTLLVGYDFVIAQNQYALKHCLQTFVHQVIEKINQTTWKPQPLSFEVSIPHIFSIPEEFQENLESPEDVLPASRVEVEKDIKAVRKNLSSKSNEGGLYVDKRSRQVWVDGQLQPHRLTTDECKLLLFLASHNAEVCSRAETVLAVYGTAYDAEVDDGRLDALIGHIRKKIGDDPRSPRFLYTIYHGGHQLRDYKGNKR